MTLKIKKKKKPALKLKPKTEEVVKPKYSNLRQVMDYSRGLTTFFSGVEYETYLDILYDLGQRNFLMSYEYLKAKGARQLKKYKDMHLFIDSGAYTYLTDPAYESVTVEEWEAHLEKYLQWARKHHEQIFALANLDIQDLVGLDKVKEWNKKYFEPFMLETGTPVCFLYHGEGIQEWEYMCQRYPYVGFSMAVEDSEDGLTMADLMKVAEKHNALVQVMACTKTKYVTTYPYYSVDSTSWNIGLKYGEFTIWRGTNSGRVKKEDFDRRALPYIEKYSYPFDIQKIRDEDKTELIKVNAWAHIEVNKYVNERMKSMQYWKKAKIVKRDVNELPKDIFPDPERLNIPFNEDGSYTLEELKEFARKLNINPELEDLYNYVFDVSTFCNWNDSTWEDCKAFYEEDDSIIDELHDEYVNRIVATTDEKINDLIGFFIQTVAGVQDKLLHKGTNFDRTIKERDDYLEDDEEEETVDMSPQETRVRLLAQIEDEDGELVDKELEEMDKEIFSKADIVPTFDARGKFVKGQRSVRKPKRVYSKKFPKLACDNCFNAQRCPEYKSGYACAFNKLFDRFDTRNMNDIIGAMTSMTDQNLARMQFAMISEKLTGQLDPQVSNLINQNMTMLNNLKSIYENSSAETLRQSRIMRSDGTIEEETHITNPKSGGILEKLFLNSGATSEDIEDDDIIDVDVDDKNTEEVAEDDKE